MLLIQQHYLIFVCYTCVQHVENAHYWYYILELGFYWSLLLCVSVDVKRKVSVMLLASLEIEHVFQLFDLFLLCKTYTGCLKVCGQLTMTASKAMELNKELVSP